MSFFKTESAGDLNIAQAIIAPAVTVMTVDGHIEETEVDELANMVRFSPVFGGMPTREVMGLAAEVIRRIRDDGPDVVNAWAAEQLTPALRETAYCFAVRVAHADHRIAEAECTALGALQDRLGIPRTTAAKIAEVMAIMNRGV